MASWASKPTIATPDEPEGTYPVNPGNPYNNVPSTPSPTTSPQMNSERSANSLHPTSPPARTSSYVPSPLNPHATGSTSTRSRPASWGAGHDKHSNGEGSSSSASSGERDTLKGIVTGAVGAGFGPYSVGPLRNSFAPPPHNRFSTLSSVGSVISLSSDSKYPVYGGGTQPSSQSGAFLPYSDSPHIDYGQDQVDDDDALHEPDSKFKGKGSLLNIRGTLNILFVVLIIGALVTLFAGYPIISYFRNPNMNIGLGKGVNGTGQVAVLDHMPQLIDPETPQEAHNIKGYDGEDYELVFSDEFNTEGRTFYPGEDPFWEAVDLWYWATGDLQWYDPGQIKTEGGALVITLEQTPHNGLNYKSGMLQSWNKFCMTGGHIEVAATFPGASSASGYWPGAWTMGNLGRPGFGASTDGIWPYSYDSCDVGTLRNQSRPDGTPTAAMTGGKKKYNGNLSWLAGQKLSACTCKGEDHPGPDHSKGRGAPEIDIFEAEKNKYGPGGATSQSAQLAPFAAAYQFPNTSEHVTIYSPERTILSDFKGSGVQQSVSCLTNTEDSWFQLQGEQWSVFGMEWQPNPDNRGAAYINWGSGGRPSWGMKGTAAGPSPEVEISQRLISEEPMAIVLNLAISESFQQVLLDTLHFPAKLRFDYIRVYQKKGQTNLGCDPKDHPTAKYIADHIDAYTNRNLTNWAAAGYNFPRSSLRDGSC